MSSNVTREFRQVKRNGIIPSNSSSLRNSLFEELKNLKEKKNIPIVFLKYLKKYQQNNFSIKEVIKLALNEKNVKFFENCKQKNLTKEIINFIIIDIKKTRNEFSNPSLFFKFININNLKNLQGEDLENLIIVALEKLNIYISCDKNLIGTIFNILKLNDDRILKKTKKLVFDEMINSFYLYFYEFQNKKQRGDNEMLKNFISHFKIFSFFLKNKFFVQLDKNTQENIIRITLASFFIGSSMEANIFQNLNQLASDLNENIKRRNNDFYFKNKKTTPNSQLLKDIEKEMSSFSDYNNCVTHKNFNEEVLKNLYIFISKFFNLLLNKIPHLFYSSLIWSVVIGENYYSNAILDYLKNSDFINSSFKEEDLNLEIMADLFMPNFIESYQANQKTKIFDLDDLNKFYNQYIQKLILNEDSLVLLFHTTPHLFIKYYLLEIFQNLLKNFPINLIDFKKSDIHKVDNIYIQMTQSFQSFVFILFLEIFQNIEIENYLKELINFLIFFIEQEFFYKFDFQIFLKIIEFIFMKVFSLKNKNLNSFKQGVRLLRFFLPKSNSNFNNLNEEEKKALKFFTVKIYIILAEFMQYHNAKKFVNLSEDLLIYILNIYRGILMSPIFDPENHFLNFRSLFITFINIIEHKKGKIKEKIFSSFMAFFNLYKNKIVEKEEDFIDFKVILAFIINYSVKDATYCLSNFDGFDASYVLFIRDRDYLLNNNFKNFCYFILKKMRKKNRNILKTYLETNNENDELQKKYLNDYKLILKDLTFHIKDQINKVEIYFCMNILKSDIIEVEFKLNIFKKIFSSSTKDVQDFFESLFIHLKQGIYTEAVYLNRDFMISYFMYLFQNIKSKSVSKTIMKITFFLLKKCLVNNLMTFDENCILKCLTNNIELKKKIWNKNINKIKKNSSPIHAFIKDPEVFLEDIKNFQPRSKRFSEDASIKNFNLENLHLLIRENTFENLDFDKFVYLKYYLRYLLIEVIEINENKTHGLFFLQVMDFYQYTKNYFSQESFKKEDESKNIKDFEQNKNINEKGEFVEDDLKINLNEKTINRKSPFSSKKSLKVILIEDKKILNFYMSKIGNNIILDSYLLKSLFISTDFLDQIEEESIIRLNEYILDSDSQLNTKEKLEFNNNYIKNRNEIKAYLFEIKILFLNFLLSKNKDTLIRNYLKRIKEFFEELKKFFSHSCDCEFIEFDEKTSDSKRKDFLEINLVSYIGLQDLQNFFKKNFLDDFSTSVYLKKIFEVFKSILVFIEKDDKIVVKFSKVEKLEELSRYTFNNDNYSFENIWKSQENGFINSYL